MAEKIGAEKRPDRTLGTNHDTFWDYCAKGELRLQKCGKCGHIQWPVKHKCESCGATDFTWEAMSGKGKVVSWCTFERDYYGGMLPIPWDTILVALDEGPTFLSNPKGFSWLDMSLDMPVKVAFIDCEDSAGAYKSPVFERA